MKISAIARKGVLIVFLILLAGIFVWLFCIIFQPLEPHYQEPQYEGKKLTDWAQNVDQGTFFGHLIIPTDRKQSEQAIAAIRHIGTNALPVAVKLCGAKDSWLKTKLEEWIDQYNYEAVNHNLGLPKDQWRSQFPIRVTPAWDQHYYGANIIWALGPAAKPIIPDLIRLLENQDQLYDDTMTALLGTGTNAIPPLLKLLDSANPEVRLRAAIVLGNFFQPKEPLTPTRALVVAGSEDFRLEARAAVPVLLQYLENPNQNSLTRARVIYSLDLIHEDASIAVPAILRLMRSQTNQWMFPGYIQVLGNYGTNAKPAVPLLVHILESDSRFPSPESPAGYRQAWVLGALEKIDPETAKPFVKKWKGSQTNSPFPNAAKIVYSPNLPNANLKRSKPDQINSTNRNTR